ncbi:MAG: transcriptional repressor [Planctomycetota bacterium]
MQRKSRHRDAVQGLLQESEGPLSAAEVRDALEATGIGQATVYRLLNEGVEDGVFKAVEMPQGPTRYEPKDLPHHHHFECTACGKVFDIEGCPGGLKKLLPKGFSLEAHEVLLYGRCEACG